MASRDTESSMGAALSVPAPFLYGSCQVVPALARTPPVQAVPADLLAAMKPRQRWSPDPVPVGTHRQRRAHPVLRLELLSGSRRMLRSYCRGRYDGRDHHLMRVHLRLPMFFVCQTALLLFMLCTYHAVGLAQMPHMFLLNHCPGIGVKHRCPVLGVVCMGCWRLIVVTYRSRSTVRRLKLPPKRPYLY